MREYRFQATEQTIESLRKLRGAWKHFRASERELVVTLADGTEVTVSVEPADVEDLFEAYRIQAVDVSSGAAEGAKPEVHEAVDAAVSRNGTHAEAGSEPAFAAGHDEGGEPADDFAAGSNDVVLFTGATWSESAARTADSIITDGVEPHGGSSMHFSGHPGQLSETAEVVCITTDAVVVATTGGTGMLVRIGLKPNTLDVIRDAETIANFVRERGYQPD